MWYFSYLLCFFWSMNIVDDIIVPQCQNIGPACAFCSMMTQQGSPKLDIESKQSTLKTLRSSSGLSTFGTIGSTFLCLSMAQSQVFWCSTWNDQRYIPKQWAWASKSCWGCGLWESAPGPFTGGEKALEASSCGFHVHRGLFQWPRNPYWLPKSGALSTSWLPFEQKKKLTFNSGKL